MIEEKKINIIDEIIRFMRESYARIEEEKVYETFFRESILTIFGIETFASDEISISVENAIMRIKTLYIDPLFLSHEKKEDYMILSLKEQNGRELMRIEKDRDGLKQEIYVTNEEGIATKTMQANYKQGTCAYTVQRADGYIIGSKTFLYKENEMKLMAEEIFSALKTKTKKLQQTKVKEYKLQ